MVLLIFAMVFGLCNGRGHCTSRLKRDGFASTLPKFGTAVPRLPVVVASPSSGRYEIAQSEGLVQMLPLPYPPTLVYGYSGRAKNAVTGADEGFYFGTPGPTFEVTHGVRIEVKFTNNISNPHFLPVDPTLHWANPNGMSMMLSGPAPPFPPGIPEAQADVALVPHLHGNIFFFFFFFLFFFIFHF